MAKEVIILAPFNGKVIELDKVDDAVFAGKMIGDGFAVRPDADVKEVLSPVEKGYVKMAFEGGHAYGLEIKKSTAELLVHIGIETVGLKGEGFDQKVFADDKLKKGSVLTGIDLAILSKKAKSTDTMILVTNETVGDYKIERIAGETVKAGEPLFKLV